jgi:hypothetical protein
MDPQACLTRVFDALIDGDLEEAAFAIDDLRNWLGRGGHAPTIDSAYIYKLREVIVRQWRKSQDA